MRTIPKPPQPRAGTRLFELLLISLVAIGIIYRFTWLNWSQGTNLHPDEYGLANTLTQVHLPDSFSEYINTRLSPLSPYQKYDSAGAPTQAGPDNSLRWGQWPIILLRWFGEVTGNTGYNEIRLMGRGLSALADSLSLLLVYLAGRRLYGSQVALLALALSALTVMQIQQSHFMTVDNFGVLFSSAALYCAVRIAQEPALRRRVETGSEAGRPGAAYQLHWQAGSWYALFGVTFGMAVASRINLLPLSMMVLVAAFLSVADLRLRDRSDLLRITSGTVLYLALSGIAALLAFRVTQPMSFRAPTGDTNLFHFHLNHEWVESMKLSLSESRGNGGGPPAEQWANRPRVIFPLINLVVWGQGLPLGLMAWAGFGWASWRVLRHGDGWRAHLLPLAWVGGFFLFMATRWACSIRYLLPIYPFLSLLAAWALVRLWQPGSPGKLPRSAAACLLGAILLGTFVWATAFVQAIYVRDHTRIQASQWIYTHVPAPFQLTILTENGPQILQIPAPSDLLVSAGMPFSQPVVAQYSGMLQSVTVPLAEEDSAGGFPSQLHIRLARDPSGEQPMAEALLEVPPGRGQPASAGFPPTAIEAGQTYYLVATTSGEGSIKIRRMAVANESWDEGLPLPLAGYGPFDQFYSGLVMQVRWYDDENKRLMFLENLAQVDTIILPSQRAIWSAARIPLTYPMTMEYYRALFDGRLGFDLVATFQSPIRIGPLQISDVGGTLAWNETPRLPLFNDNLLAAEEAFSVYDHPPVWVFQKRPDFRIEMARAVLEAVDLSKVVVESPRNATRNVER